MSGRVAQLNVSAGGIPKRPVEEALLEMRGFHGDSWAHPQIHGGSRQTALMIASEAIEDLRRLGYPLFPGALGENLTVVGLDCRLWRTGQRYSVGLAIIELTKVRSPCRTLDIYGCVPNGVPVQSAIYDVAVKRGDASSPRWAMSGFYAKVVSEGLVRAGDSIVLL